jgi:lactate permease
VAFGAIAIPITTLGQVTGLPVQHLSSMVGRQTPFLAFILPFILVFMVDGRRGVKAVWPAALTAGFVFAVLQFVMSNYISMQLTDIVASLGSAGALVLFLRVWQPNAPAMSTTARGQQRPAIAGGSTGDAAFERDVRARSSQDEGPPPSRKEMLLAFAPYLIIVVVLGVMSLNSVIKWLDGATTEFLWPGLHIVGASGKTPTSETFKLNWFTAAGTGLLLSGILTAMVLRVNPLRGLRLGHAQADQVGPGHRHGRTGHRLRDEHVGPDDHPGHLGGRGRRVLRLPVADHRLVRDRGDRL